MEYPPQSTKESKMSVCARVLSHFSCVRLSATPWTMARQAPLSMGFSRQEYLSGPPFPSPVIKYEVSEVKSLSCVWLFATPGTVAYQAPPSMGFSRQEYLENGRNGLPFPSPQNAVLGCNLKDDQEWWTKNDLGSFPGQRFQHHSNPSLWPNH